MPSRPVYRGFGRSNGISTSFHPAKGRFGRMERLSTPFYPVKSGFGRMGRFSTPFHPVKQAFGRMAALIAEAQAQASRLIELGAALVNNMYSMFMTLFHFFQQRYFVLLAGLPPIHFGREDSVERTLLRIACQSETILVPPWQGGIDIRVL